MSYCFYRYENTSDDEKTNKFVIRNLLQLVHLGIRAGAASTAAANVCLRLPATCFLRKPTVAVFCRCYASCALSYWSCPENLACHLVAWRGT